MSPPPHDRSDFRYVQVLNIRAGLEQMGLVLAAIIQHLRLSGSRTMSWIFKGARTGYAEQATLSRPDVVD